VEDQKYYQKMDVPVTQPPGTVVSLVPSVTESMFDLNLGSRLIAVTDYCVYPPEGVARLPKIGGTKNPDVQRIIDMRPELVIANQEENRKEDVEDLQAAGIPVWVTFPRTVRDAMNLLWNIMYVFEETSMVPRVRLIEQTLDWVEGISRAKEDRVCRVFAPIWHDPLMTFNADTFAHDLLFVCGGTNVFAERERQYPLSADLGKTEPYNADDPRVSGRDTRYPRITLEEVTEAQPDVILLPSEPFHFTESHIPQFAALDVPAARNNRIHLIDGSLLTWHGTRVAYALNAIPELMCPEEDDAN
jgi:ABC-type Fe3+-hydroxamate transport system substrate-binding protein